MKNKKQLFIGLGIGFVVAIIAIVIIAKVVENIEYSDREEKKALKNISYKISDKFEKDDYGYAIYYSYYNDNISCHFRINANENYYDEYKDGSDYLKRRIYFTYNDKVSEIKEVELNNYKWYYLTKESDGDIEYIYATLKDDNIYELKYDINDYVNGDGTSNFCANEYDKIISTVKFKK